MSSTWTNQRFSFTGCCSLFIGKLLSESLDISPRSLLFQGVESAGGQLTAMIKRNTTVPTKQTMTFAVIPYDQSNQIRTELVQFDKKNPMKQTETMKAFAGKYFDVQIKVFEGEYRQTKDDCLLGQCTFSNLLFPSNQIALIDITFDLDPYGLLIVSAIDQTSQKEVRMTITNERDRLSNSDVELITTRLQNYHLEERNELERTAAKNSLETYCLHLKEIINQNRSTEQLFKTIDQTIKWLDDNEVNTIQSRQIFFLFVETLLLLFRIREKKNTKEN